MQIISCENGTFLSVYAHMQITCLVGLCFLNIFFLTHLRQSNDVFFGSLKY
jgi:hypothetical protein